MVNSFSIYKEYYELITLLSEKEQQELLLAITKYMFEDIEPTLNSKQTKIFNNLKRPLDKSKNKSKNRTKTKSNQNQNEIKSKSNENQNQIKAETHQDVPVTVNVNVDVSNSNSYSYCEEQFGRVLSPVEYELISKWREWFTDDIINYAIDKTIRNGARALSYTEAIINSWHDKGFKTLRECELEKKSKEDKPDWYGKNIEEDEASEEEIKKLEKVLNGNKEV